MSKFFTETSVKEVDVEEIIKLRFGTEEVEIPYNLAQGKKLPELVNEYSEDLGVDVSRISSYREGGNIIPSDQVSQTNIQVGTMYVIGINAEAKGC